MPRFRDQKKHLAHLCAQENWQESLHAEISGLEAAVGAVNAFLALLNRPEFKWQSAYGLGLCLPFMVRDTMESARVFMRRLMWSLNEESGNLGWGIPEAMGCILASSPALAKEYARIFISYGYETGKDDNFLDHAPLRRGVYWGIGWLARHNREAALPALPHLAAALGNEDAGICAYAAWAVGQFVANSRALRETDENYGPTALAALERERANREKNGQGLAIIELFDGRAIVEKTLDSILQEASGVVREMVASGIRNEDKGSVMSPESR